MTDLSVRCLAADSGQPCTDIVTSAVPVALCQRHRMQVAISIVPEMLAAAASGTVQQSVFGKAVQPVFSGPHEPVVYFIANGDRVKIGYSTNLGGRLSSLAQPKENVALTLAGGRELEAALHDRFKDARVRRSEWFKYTRDIKQFVASHNPSEAEAFDLRKRQTDDLLAQAAELVTSTGIASATMLQQRLKIGFSRAAKLLDALEQRGFISPCPGPGHSRKVFADTGDDSFDAATASSDQVRAAVARLVGDDRGVLLTTVRERFGLGDTKAVRDLLDKADINVRPGVRTPKGNGPGVHRYDVINGRLVKSS
jgi:DNA-binding MarR family transcriptional regulator